MKEIVIARDFSETPGGRFEEEGPDSGEKFRNELLLPLYHEAINNSEKVSINFDGCYGYATSFLEESFGGLVRAINKKGVLNNIIIISKDDALLESLVRKYVKEAEEHL